MSREHQHVMHVDVPADALFARARVTQSSNACLVHKTSVRTSIADLFLTLVLMAFLYSFVFLACFTVRRV